MLLCVALNPAKFLPSLADINRRRAPRWAPEIHAWLSTCPLTGFCGCV